MYENLGATFAALIVALITYGVVELRGRLEAKKVAAKKQQKLQSLALAYDQDLAIHVMLDECLRKFGAQRAYLSRLHNGDAFLGNEEILKKSRTHERVRPGTSYQAEVYRGMLTSSVPDEMRLIQQEGSGWTVVADLDPSKFRWLCDQAGATAVARAAVKRDNRIIGFIGLDFDAKEPVKPANIEDIVGVAFRIAGILAHYIPDA